jgi:hypothetical protein
MSQEDAPHCETPVATADATYEWTGARISAAVALLVILAVLVAVGFDVFKRDMVQQESLRLPGGLNYEHLIIDEMELETGGVPVDGIPAVTDPKVTSVGQASYLSPAERVVGVGVNDRWRAYPVGVLNFHEAINDELAGTPIGVFYCPLCDSVSVVDRRINGKTLVFGISGLLYNSNVVLFDRTDHALWSQVKTMAISGPNAGKALQHLTNWELSSFADFRKRHPDATVMMYPPPSGRDYSKNPYSAYFEDDKVMMRANLLDDRLAQNKTPVIGVRLGQTTRAYPIDALRKVIAAANDGTGILADTIDGQPIRLGLDLVTGTIRVLDAPTEAQVVHTFWFAWAAMHPQTELYTAGP